MHSLTLVLKGGKGLMFADSGHGSAAKGLAIGLEVAGSGPVSCKFFLSLFFLYRVYLVFH